MSTEQLRAWWNVVNRELSRVSKPTAWHLTQLREFIVEVQNARLTERWTGGNVKSIELMRLLRECSRTIERVTNKTRRT